MKINTSQRGMAAAIAIDQARCAAASIEDVHRADLVGHRGVDHIGTWPSDRRELLSSTRINARTVGGDVTVAPSIAIAISYKNTIVADHLDRGRGPIECPAITGW